MYARIGTCTQEFGTLASWLVDVLNVLTGNLDRPGGAMFAKPATGSGNTGGTSGKGRGVRFGRRHSRVRGLPEFFGELPVVCLAEEIETPGDGQVRALLTLAGNPAVSTPDAERLDRALGTLEFMVSVDIYLNETTRHADVFLPAEPELTRGHYDVALYNLAIRNVANYSPPLFELDAGAMPEWQILLRLAAILGGQGADADIDALDDFVITGLVQKAVASARFQRRRPRRRRAVERARVAARSGTHPRLHAAHRPVRRRLRCRPRRSEPGEARGAPARHRPRPAATARARGPAHAERQDRAWHQSNVSTTSPGCAAVLERDRPELVLVGRRDLRSNNSWMHNLPVLVKGKARCTLHVHPDDARASRCRRRRLRPRPLRDR